MRFLYQLGLTWLHFGSRNLPKSRLGGVLGCLVGVLGHLGGVLRRLEASWRRLRPSWGRLGASWARLGASWARFEFNYVKRGPGSQLRLAPVTPPPTSNEEGKLLKGDIQTDYRPLQTTFLWTQTRSWAPSGPVRIQSAAELRPRHRASSKVTK